MGRIGVMKGKEDGFTLLELLVVLMIIALLAGFVGPRLFSNVDKAKENTAMQQMKSLSNALAQYRLDVGQYPTEAQGLNSLVKKPKGVNNWRGPYLSKNVPVDPWGKEYIWNNPSQDNADFSEVEIISTGAKGKKIRLGF